MLCALAWLAPSAQARMVPLENIAALCPGQLIHSSEDAANSPPHGENEVAAFQSEPNRVVRWLSEDPIGEEGGINLYGYVGNGPTGAWDPYGLDINGIEPGQDNYWTTRNQQSNSGYFIFNVDGHGSPNVVALWDPNALKKGGDGKISKGNYVPISPAKLAEMIFHSPGSHGQTVRLNACSAGAASQIPNTPNYAIQLAKELSKLNGNNTEVWAPDKLIKVQPENRGWLLGEAVRSPNGATGFVPDGRDQSQYKIFNQNSK